MNNKLEEYKKLASKNIHNELCVRFRNESNDKLFELWYEFIVNQTIYEGNLYEFSFNEVAVFKFVQQCFENYEIKTQIIHIPTEIVRKNNNKQ